MPDPHPKADQQGQTAFYGWKIVYVSAFANAIVMGLGTLNFGLFIQPMESELGITRAQFGWANSLRQLAGAASSPFLGRAIDRYGTRWLLAASSLIACICIAALAWIDAGWQLIALFAVIGLVGCIGPGQLLTTVPVTKWFVTDRARAIAIMSFGVPLGAMIFLPLTQYLIDDYGWRNTWIILAVIGAIGICPACLKWMRREPEDLGLRVDGHPPEHQIDANQNEPAWTVGEARRTLVFWQLALATGIVAFAISTVALHRLPAFADAGIEPMYIALAIAWDAVLAGLGTFLFGMLGSRVQTRLVGSFGFLLLGIGVALTIYVADLVMLFIAMSIWGVGIGGMMYINNMVWAEYFGREHVGAVRGFVMPITMILGAIGAPIAGYIYDSTGSYDPVWWGSTALMFGAAVLIFTSHAPGKSPSQLTASG